jgi:hypothetical protein
MRNLNLNAPIILIKPSREDLSLPEPTGVITLHAASTPTRKRRGEAAEAAFLARATHLDFTVCLPWESVS